MHSCLNANVETVVLFQIIQNKAASRDVKDPIIQRNNIRDIDRTIYKRKVNDSQDESKMDCLVIWLLIGIFTQCKTTKCCVIQTNIIPTLTFINLVEADTKEGNRRENTNEG